MKEEKNKLFTKKYLVFFVGLFLIITPIVSSYSVKIDKKNRSENSQIEKLDVKKWTYMLYDDADFISSWYDPGISDITRCTPLCKNVNIVVLQDTVYGPARLWKVGPLGFKKTIKWMGEVDMGDYKTLKDFVNFCKDSFPAERYMLDIFNHGNGWQGACSDVTNNSFLNMYEMKKALLETGEVDILTFTAPCTMAAVESVYELRDCCDVYVGSEAGNGYDFRVLRPTFRMLNKDFHLNNIEIGEKIIDIRKKVESRFSDFLFVTDTMSAMRTDYIDDLTESVENLSFYLNKNFDLLKKDIKQVINNTQRFYNEIDLYDFCKNFKKISNFKIVLTKLLDDVMKNINKTVIDEYHSERYPDSYGLSIYLPYFLLPNNPYISDDYPLDFANDTYWDEFILNYSEEFHNLITVDTKGKGDFFCIQDAVDNATFGYTIYVYNGTYYENIVINETINLIGENRENTIIDGCSSGNVFEIKKVSAVINLNIRNSGKNSYGIISEANYSFISNCIINNNDKGVFLYNSDFGYVVSNIIKNNDIGLELKNSNENTIQQNRFIENDVDAFFYDCFKNDWNVNFWGKTRILPKIIFGKKTFLNFSIPTFDIDFIPLRA